MQYIARKPFRYGPGVYLTGQTVTVNDPEEVKMLQGQGKIGGPVVEKPVRETATVKPPENSMQPQAEVKVIQPEPEQDWYSDMTVAELREVLKEKDLPTYGTKAELLERLEGD
jgi:hypothetical protein